jgi:hypothetical protein
MNGGTCVDHVNDYECECLKDFTGFNCETKVTVEVSTVVTITKVTTDNTGEHINRYFYSTCWGQNLWLRLMLKQNGFSGWMKSLFDKKDNEAWLANLLAKKDISLEQSFKLSALLKDHEMHLAEGDDETSRWWKNLEEKNWNGCVPYWSKIQCKKELEDRETTEVIEDVLEAAPVPTTAAPTTTAAPLEVAPESESESFNGQCKNGRWETFIDVKLEGKNAKLNKYSDRETFNAAAKKSQYIRYTTNKIGTAIYKRKTAWTASSDPYDLMVNTWSVKNDNVFHTDFDIYSTFEDAQAEEREWKYCNGDDKGVGFPRDCDPKKKFNWRWFSFPKNQDSMDEVDFIPRFDLNYMLNRHKTYVEASFEIYVCDDEETVRIPDQLVAPKPFDLEDMPVKLDSFQI